MNVIICILLLCISLCFVRVYVFVCVLDSLVNSRVAEDELQMTDKFDSLFDVCGTY